MEENENASVSKGQITTVIPQGSIILVLYLDKTGRIGSIPFDWRNFQDLVNGEGLTGPADLVGRNVTVTATDTQTYISFDA